MTDFRLLTPVEIERLVRARLKVVRSQLSKLAITSISAQTVSSRELQKENRSVPSGLLIWQLTWPVSTPWLSAKLTLPKCKIAARTRHISWTVLSGKVKVLSASYELRWLEPVCLTSIVLIEYLNSAEVLHVVNGVDLRAATALEVVVRGGITSQEEALQLIVGEASKYLIKDVEAALSSTTLHDTRLLQQICIKY